MSGIVAAIWHLVLRINLFYGNLYFHAIGPISFWFDYCLFKQPFTGSLNTEPGVTINSIFLF